MSNEVKVPTLGESITEATIGEWLKQPGDAVGQDEPIASLETDKVSVEVMAPAAGVLGEQLAKVGDRRRRRTCCQVRKRNRTRAGSRVRRDSGHAHTLPGRAPGRA
jgi:hypothetical protein